MMQAKLIESSLVGKYNKWSFFGGENELGLTLKGYIEPKEPFNFNNTSGISCLISKHADVTNRVKRANSWNAPLKSKWK